MALVTAACSADVNGSELGGVAQWYGASPGSAMNAATAHCQKYGRAARVSQIQPNVGYLTFSCDRPDKS
jgi:hypothetical protein